MKKLIALVLALLMALSLGAVAFAADCGVNLDGGSCSVDISNYKLHLLPGEKFSLSDTDSAKTIKISPLSTPVGDLSKVLNSNAWRVSVKWNVGTALVNSLRWDKSASAWVLKLNENYTITTPKKLYGTVTFTSRSNKRNLVKGTISAIVSNHLVELDGSRKLSDADTIDAADNTVYKCTSTGYIKFNDDRLLTCNLKMVKNEKAFMYSNESIQDAIEEKYGDRNADIECYAFGGRPTFKNAAQFTLQADYANQYYIYQWNGTRLSKIKATWDSINGIYKWSTNSPTSYVISDTNLLSSK